MTGGGGLEPLSNWIEFSTYENNILGYWAFDPVQNKNVAGYREKKNCVMANKHNQMEEGIRML
jgi:hypothetical protein